MTVNNGMANVVGIDVFHFTTQTRQEKKASIYVIDRVTAYSLLVKLQGINCPMFARYRLFEWNNTPRASETPRSDVDFRFMHASGTFG